MLVRLIFLMLLLVGICLPVLGQEPASEIHILPLTDGDWRVEYHLAYPVDSLQFMRTAGFLREDNWRVQTPGYRFMRNDDGQALIRDDGAVAASAISIEFPVDTRFIVRDYELFNQFADGSLALFTGHFYVRSSGEQVPEEYSRGFLTGINITPPKGKSIGLQGNLHSEPISWTDARGEGTYVYIGNTPALHTESVTAIFDPGLPEWVVKQAQLRIPQLLALYAQKMGPHSTVAPLVLFSYEPDSPQEYGYNGGTRDDLIQLRISGPSWQQQSDKPMRNLVHFFAHEAAHLWNGQAVLSAPGTPPWIGEGSADALAESALYSMGLITEAEFWQLKNSALNACISGLKSGGSLDATTQHRVHYDCGNWMSLWAERALEQVGKSQDLFDLWQHLIKTSADGTYDQASYFKALQDLGVEPKQVEAMQSFARAENENPAQALLEAFAPLEIKLERNDKAAPASAFVEANGQVLTALLKADCTNGYGFYAHKDHFMLAGLKGCKTAANDMRITHMEGIAVKAKEFSAYHAAAAACAENGEVTLGSEQQHIVVPCKTELPKLVGWWQVNLQ